MNITLTDIAENPIFLHPTAGSEGHALLTVEVSAFYDDGQGLSPLAQQKVRPDRKHERPVRVEVVIDDPVGIVRRWPTHSFDLDIAILETGHVQDAVVLIEASRGRVRSGKATLLPADAEPPGKTVTFRVMFASPAFWTARLERSGLF